MREMPEMRCAWAVIAAGGMCSDRPSAPTRNDELLTFAEALTVTMRSPAMVDAVHVGSQSRSSRWPMSFSGAAPPVRLCHGPKNVQRRLETVLLQGPRDCVQRIPLNLHYLLPSVSGGAAMGITLFAGGSQSE